MTWSAQIHVDHRKIQVVTSQPLRREERDAIARTIVEFIVDPRVKDGAAYIIDHGAPIEEALTRWPA